MVDHGGHQGATHDATGNEGRKRNPERCAEAQPAAGDTRGGLPPRVVQRLQPRLLRMLAPCHLVSWAGLHLADLRMALLPGRIHPCFINVVFIRRHTEDLRSLSASCRCWRHPSVRNVDTSLFTQPDPFVRAFVKRATLSQLRIQDDSNAL